MKSFNVASLLVLGATILSVSSCGKEATSLSRTDEGLNTASQETRCDCNMCPVVAAPNVTMVTNAASFGEAVSPGNTATLFGDKFDQVTSIRVSQAIPGSFSLFEQDVDILYRSKNQLNFMVPSSLVVGRALIKATFADHLEAREFILSSGSPGIFSANKNGVGAAAGYAWIGANMLQQDLFQLSPAGAYMETKLLTQANPNQQIQATFFTTGKYQGRLVSSDGMQVLACQSNGSTVVKIAGTSVPVVSHQDLYEQISLAPVSAASGAVQVNYAQKVTVNLSGYIASANASLLNQDLPVTLTLNDCEGHDQTSNAVTIRLNRGY